MYERCIEHGERKFDYEEFQKITKPVIEWIQKNCCPHDYILINYARAELLSGEMFCSAKIPD